MNQSTGRKNLKAGAGVGCSPHENAVIAGISDKQIAGAREREPGTKRDRVRQYCLSARVWVNQNEIRMSADEVTNKQVTFVPCLGSLTDEQPRHRREHSEDCSFHSAKCF